ncbi:MAG: tetratricopeptide repeat protein [Thioalkalivibrionaceae bacterium]
MLIGLFAALSVGSPHTVLAQEPSDSSEYRVETSIASQSASTGAEMYRGTDAQDVRAGYDKQAGEFDERVLGLPPIAEWEELHEAGALEAQTLEQIGWLYEQGHVGDQPNLEHALQWYERAAEAGLHRNAVRVAWMYLGGRGAPTSRVEAERWLQYAIEHDHLPGHTALASVLIADAMAGRATERMPEAIELLESALDRGFDTASYFLTRVYLEGLGGIEADYAKGAEYARMGAEAGNAQQQGWLAFLLAEGRGVEPDLVEALTWASLAAADGDALGQNLRVWLEEQLPEASVREAREAAVAWALER